MSLPNLQRYTHSYNNTRRNHLISQRDALRRHRRLSRQQFILQVLFYRLQFQYDSSTMIYLLQLLYRRSWQTVHTRRQWTKKRRNMSTVTSKKRTCMRLCISLLRKKRKQQKRNPFLLENISQPSGQRNQIFSSACSSSLCSQSEKEFGWGVKKLRMKLMPNVCSMH